MVDSLNLNPARVKKILTENGYRAYGRFPNRKNRNGKEQVSYEQFYEELKSPQQMPLGIMTSFNEKSASYSSFRLTLPM